MLRALVKQRLTAAAEEIFVLFERTIAEYEEELSRSKEENERQRKLLDAVFKPEVRLHRADVQRLSVSKQECPDQEDPEPPHIKEEQEEVWSSQEGEQLQGLEEADISKWKQELMERTVEDQNQPGTQIQINIYNQMLMRSLSDSSDPETEDSDENWKETREAQSGLNCGGLIGRRISRNNFMRVELGRPGLTVIGGDRYAAFKRPAFIRVSKQECPDQEDPEPPHIKEEQEEVWSSQEGEQLQGLEEADISKWKQELMERTVEDQNQPGTQIQNSIHSYMLRKRRPLPLNLRLMTVVVTGRRPEKLSR
ncbi:hypothetical protein L3Q82_015372, partial [Scortum barcoo]